jgi:molecular chaperone DnaK
MVKEAEEQAEEDKKRREFVENRNRLDELIYRTDKSFKELKDKLSEADKKELEDALEQGRKALKSEDIGEIQSAMERITRASHKIAEVAYKQASGAGTGTYGAGEGTEGGEAGKKKGGDDVIDAEFTEK